MVARDGDVDQIAGANSVLHATHGGPLAEVRNVGAGQSLGRAGELGGQAVGRQRWSQLEPAQVVLVGKNISSGVCPPNAGWGILVLCSLM